MKKSIQIISYKTGDIVKEIDVSGKSENQIHLIDSGINRNLNHELFYTSEHEKN